MTQLHNTLSDEQVKQLLRWYQEGVMSRAEALDQLGIKQSRFYELLAHYKKDPVRFSVAYGRKTTNRRLPKPVITAIHRELEAEKRLITNPALPIMFYNYAAVRDAVVKETGHEQLAMQTVINYAKKWGFYLERPKHTQRHTREVVTDYIGMLLQHDASIHQWSPYAVSPDGTPKKWTLITTLDDHSRTLLYADLFEHESAWAHILALESVVMTYGVGLQYYSDNHGIFRYVAHRDRNGYSAANYQRVFGTDDVTPQWKQCVEAAGMKVTYALSPQAKGKIERPYRWLQDRIVRRAAREQVATIDEARAILRQEVDRYNNRQVHSTTKEIPAKRFATAQDEGRTCFRTLDLTKTIPPVTSSKDIFCLRSERVVDGYGKISLVGQPMTVPGNAPRGETITLHIVPEGELTEVRFLKGTSVLGYKRIPTPDSFRF